MSRGSAGEQKALGGRGMTRPLFGDFGQEDVVVRDDDLGGAKQQRRRTTCADRGRRRRVARLILAAQRARFADVAGDGWEPHVGAGTPD